MTAEREVWSIVPVLGARAVRASAEYYRDVLGFHLDPELGLLGDAAGEGSVYALLRRGGAEIHLQIRRQQEGERRRDPVERDVYVRVADVSDLHSELVARGVHVAAPSPTRYGLWEIQVEDPNGHRLTFGSERPTS
jgi:uncharacterized glyoxalase superfamily protein PhnB